MDWLAEFIGQREAESGAREREALEKLLDELVALRPSAETAVSVEISDDHLDRIIGAVERLRDLFDELDLDDEAGEPGDMEKASIEQWQAMARAELSRAGVSKETADAVVAAIGKVDDDAKAEAERDRESLMGMGKAQLVEMVVQGRAAVGATAQMVSIIGANQKLAEAMGSQKSPAPAAAAPAPALASQAAAASGSRGLSFGTGVGVALGVLAIVGLAALAGFDVRGTAVNLVQQAQQ